MYAIGQRGMPIEYYKLYLCLCCCQLVHIISVSCLESLSLSLIHISIITQSLHAYKPTSQQTNKTNTPTKQTPTKTHTNTPTNTLTNLHTIRQQGCSNRHPHAPTLAAIHGAVALALGTRFSADGFQRLVTLNLGGLFLDDLEGACGAVVWRR